MVATALVMSLILLALSWAAVVAVVERPRVGLAMIALGLLVAVLTPALEVAGTWPANLTGELLADGRMVELLTFVVSVEALGGLALMASQHSLARWSAVAPTPAALALAPLLSHFVLVHGPRWNLVLLAGAGWAFALLALATTLGVVLWLRRRHANLAYEVVVVLRGVAIASAAVAMAGLKHQQAPTLPFEPLAMLGSLLAFAALMLMGWWRRRSLY